MPSAVAIRHSSILVRCGGCRQPMLRLDGARFYPKGLTAFGPGNHDPLLVRGECPSCNIKWQYNGPWPEPHMSTPNT